ncbi:MAG TPA: hypothetical protein VHQ20_02250, partial [Patescibacteria group bacterium]|nr:hypothetical protein [Patescibacteria group bacterium]
MIFKKKSPTTTNTNVNTVPAVVETPPTNTAPPTPTAPATAAVRLTDAGEAVLSPILFYQGNGISYFNSGGQLFQTDLQITNGTALLSNKKQLSIALKANISKIIWPMAGNNFIAEFNSGSKPTWSVYQTNKAAYTDIPTQVYSLDWMPSGDKIMFTWVDASGKATLNIG